MVVVLSKLGKDSEHLHRNVTRRDTGGIAPRVLQTPTSQLFGLAGVLISVWPSLAFSAEQATA
jgi:hypothetical protein